jgi:prepilin-type N-terminal cleavage/methylation domain-containing protein
VRTFLSTKRIHALTLVEVLIVLAVIAILAALAISSVSHAKARAIRIACVNNLHVTGLAFNIWAGDNNGNFPMSLVETNGGTKEFITGPNAFRHFQAMSNELTSPIHVFCPSEPECRLAQRFTDLSNSNLSYFVGIDANKTNAQMILAGDRNITNGTSIRNGLLELTTNHPAAWTKEMHVKAGNLLLTDGSVLQTSTLALRQTIENTGVATNRLQMP